MPMIQTYAHQKALHEARLDIKTLERLFANLITDGTNCSPFESDIIVQKAKEIFAIGDHPEGNILQPGQMIWTAIDINEPPGKLLKHCKLKRIIITHMDPKRGYRSATTIWPFSQAPATDPSDEQGGVFAGVDVATMM